MNQTSEPTPNEFDKIFHRLTEANDGAAVSDAVTLETWRIAHEAYVNAQQAVAAIRWRVDGGSSDYRRGLETMQEDAVRAIREAAEENQS